MNILGMLFCFVLLTLLRYFARPLIGEPAMALYFDGVGEGTLYFSFFVPYPLILLLAHLSSFGFYIAVTSNGALLSRLTRASSTLPALELSLLQLLLCTGGDTDVVVVVLRLHISVTSVGPTNVWCTLIRLYFLNTSTRLGLRFRCLNWPLKYIVAFHKPTLVNRFRLSEVFCFFAINKSFTSFVICPFTFTISVINHRESPILGIT